MPDTSPIATTDVPSTGRETGAEAGDDDAGTVDAGAGAGVRADAEAFEAKVAEVIKVIRPAIQADQGDIFLRSVDADTGLVTVELTGACVDCPASTQTLKQGLERILIQRVEGVTEVRHEGEALAGFDEGTPVSL